MTLRSLLLAAALLAASEPTSAAACHRYSTWHYPWRQSCGWASAHHKANSAFSASSDARKHGALHKLIVAPHRNDFASDRNDFKIALPSLAQVDFAGGEADEPTRARILLRAAVEAANAH